MTKRMKKRLLLIAILFPAHLSGELAASQQEEPQIITAAEIKAMQAMKISDILNRLPGIKASETSVSIRGSSNVKVLLDGRSLNDPSAHSGSVKWSMISLEQIEKIVVYKGRGSVSFGDNTEGGAIVITTRSTGGGKLDGSVGGFYGSNGQRNATLDLRGSLNRFSAGLSVGTEGYDGFVDNSDKEKLRVATRFDYRLSPSVTMFLSGDYSDEEKGMRGYPERRTPNARMEYDHVSLLFGINGKWLESRAWYQNFTTKNSDTDKDFFSSVEVTTFGQSVNLQLDLPIAGTVQAGTGFEWQKASGSGFDTVTEDRGWFLLSKKLSWQKSPWSVLLGARANWYSSFDNTLNPEVKVVRKGKVLSVEASAGLTSNLPTFKQRYNETSQTRPNPDLGMERATSYALSFSLTPSPLWSGELTFFHRDITDRITYVRNAEIGRYENFGEVTYQGCELSMTWRPSEAVEFTSSYMYLHARNEETGRWLPAVPFHTLTGEVVLRPFRRLSVRAEAKYAGKVFPGSDNRSSQPDYTVVHLRADYRTGPFRFYCSVDNLFDREYRYVDGYDAPPREWLVGMNCNF